MTAQCRPEATLLSARVLSSPVGRWDRVVKFCWIPVRVAGEPGMLRALEALEDCARRLTAEGIDAAAQQYCRGDIRANFQRLGQQQYRDRVRRSLRERCG